jgi:hypothetical protein
MRIDDPRLALRPAKLYRIETKAISLLPIHRFAPRD